MKRMGLFLLFCTAFTAIFASVSPAVQLTDPSCIPPYAWAADNGRDMVMISYAWTEAGPQGNKVVKFNNTGFGFSPQRLDQILRCYGVTLKDTSSLPPNASVADNGRDVVMASYAWTEAGPQGGKVVKFNSSGFLYSPQTLDQILRCYGLTLKDPGKLPPYAWIADNGRDVVMASYAWTETDPQGNKVVKFNSSGWFVYSPQTLNQILEAYD